MGCSCSKGKVPKESGATSRQRIEDEYKAKYGKNRPPIEHVVVLMLENRTFDNVLGVWMDRRMKKGEVQPSRWDVGAREGKGIYDYFNTVTPYKKGATPSPGFNQERGKSSELYEDNTVKFPVWSRDPKMEDVFTPEALGVPNGDPAEKFELLNICLFGEHDPAADAPVLLDGFAGQYYEREMHDARLLNDEWPDKTDFEKLRSPAMHVYLPEQMGVLTQLADNFGCSDTYFSSCPCQTWPNRHFATSGHCYGYVNNLVDVGMPYDHDKTNTMKTVSRLLQFDKDTIFNKLEDNGVDWNIFAGDFPLSVIIASKMHFPPTDKRHVLNLSEFHKHANEGILPAFTWIEPQFLQAGDEPPNDMHPPHNTLHGQKLIADLYASLRSNEDAWSKTLFIVNCDEGVGVFDHVPPPAAPEPHGGHTHTHISQTCPKSMKNNPFERYGTRVPCLLLSPLLDPGSVVRPDEKYSEFPFDHTSVIRTVLDLFVGTDCHLTKRDQLAPSFAPYLRDSPRTDLGPSSIALPAPMSSCDQSSLRKAFRDGMVGGTRGGCHSVLFLFKAMALMDHAGFSGLQTLATQGEALEHIFGKDFNQFENEFKLLGQEFGKDISHIGLLERLKMKPSPPRGLPALIHSKDKGQEKEAGKETTKCTVHV